MTTTWRSLLLLAVVAAALLGLWSWRAAHPAPGRLQHAILVRNDRRPAPTPL